MMGEQKFSQALDLFCTRLEADDVDEVSLEVVRERWIPEVIQLEDENGALMDYVKHKYNCIRDLGNGVCSCGLDSLIPVDALEDGG